MARLAVFLDCQRQGIGGILLVEAMRRALIIAENAGVIGLFVDAKDISAKTYYERYGFEGTKERPLLLFLPLSSLSNAYFTAIVIPNRNHLKNLIYDQSLKTF